MGRVIRIVVNGLLMIFQYDVLETNPAGNMHRSWMTLAGVVTSNYLLEGWRQNNFTF
ncbi:MAG: hypothetical protein ACJAY2_001040 [Pseudomonadales bacterium]|jgi:hypothetical protein